MASPETVHVWADGFDRWHARVSFPTGYTASRVARERPRIRRKARRAIRRQLSLRGQLGPGWACRVVLRDDARDHSGDTHSITYRER